MASKILSEDQIKASINIAELRAHVIACGLSAAWFDLNGYGETIGYARAAAMKAALHYCMGY